MIRASLVWPPLASTAAPVMCESSSAASTISALVERLRPSRWPSSGRLGVISAARGNSASRKAAMAAGSISAAPEVAIITGSSTIGAFTPSSARATWAMISASCSIPIFTASTPMSETQEAICSATMSPAIGAIACTPTVFCAVTAVIAVMP